MEDITRDDDDSSARQTFRYPPPSRQTLIKECLGAEPGMGIMENGVTVQQNYLTPYGHYLNMRDKGAVFVVEHGALRPTWGSYAFRSMDNDDHILEASILVYEQSLVGDRGPAEIAVRRQQAITRPFFISHQALPKNLFQTGRAWLDILSR
ncbi:MAG: hypothetical protein HYV04_10410 [Deltaproteobacteria bacterium]|nr:hypothetical protein [Deltaproteobacteria bacterium]